jgi:hypothetical protein
MISRTSSTPVWEAASISITSTCRPSMIARQWTPNSARSDRRRGRSSPGRLVVQRAGEDAGGGGLADAAHAGQHPGLGDAARVEGVRTSRPDHAGEHASVADQVVEVAVVGSVLAGEFRRR